MNIKNQIESLLDRIIKFLEKEKRILDIFKPLSKEQRFNSDRLLAAAYQDNFFDNFFSVLTDFNGFESLDLIDDNSKKQSTSILSLSRELFRLMSIFEMEHNHSCLTLLNSENAWKFVYARVLFLLLVCSSSFEYVYSDEVLKKIKNYSSGHLFYRGHSDINYKLTPSMYRKLGKDLNINPKFVAEQYELGNLFNKYRKRICRKFIVDYELCSYMQHATSFSPLLDFTKDKRIGLSFATYPNGNLNDYNTKDASLIVFSVKRIKQNIDIEQIDIDYHKDCLTIDSEIYGTPLISCTVKDFKFKFAVSTKATNDRMKYQKGIFLCFYNCVFANGIPLLPRSKGYFVTLKIKADSNTKPGEISKSDIYSKIIKHNPELDYSHLMNPYDYFCEYNKR